MKIKVLHILGDMARGGASTFIMNNMRHMDNSIVQYDFLIRNNNSAYDREVECLGGKTYVVPSFPKHFLRNYKETKRFFSDHKGEYAAVHIHANALFYTLPVKLATREWKCQVIIHSHNTHANVRGIGWIHKFNRKFKIPKQCILLACGEDAGKWMFNNRKFEVINNSVDTSKYQFSNEKREKIRVEFNVPTDCTLIGNIGRFEKQKNHLFLLNVFNSYLAINKKAILMLVGDGSMKWEIEQEARKLGIQDRVIFTGTRKDTDDFYSAFDLFLMPSLFEGLPFTLVEAQASGLPSLISDAITDEVVVTDLITKMSLYSGISEWSKKIDQMVNSKFLNSRSTYSEIVNDAGYGVQKSVECLKEIYTRGRIR